jgi:hypothetical protein
MMIATIRMIVKAHPSPVEFHPLGGSDTIESVIAFLDLPQTGIQDLINFVVRARLFVMEQDQLLHGRL